MRPKSIELFDKVYLGSLAISVASVALSWSAMVREFDGVVPGAGATGVAVSIAVGFALSLLLWWLIARRASNLGKWVLVVLTAIGIFMFLSSLFTATVPKDLSFAVTIVTNLLGVYAVWLLFRPDAVAWLESKGVEGPGDPAAFD